MKQKKFLMPESKIKLVRLWPHAARTHKRGEVWEVGYYCKSCGLNTIWLVNKNGKYAWTIDHEFLRKYFEVIEKSKIRNLYKPPRTSIKEWIDINGNKIIGRKNMGKQGKKERAGVQGTRTELIGSKTLAKIK